MTILETFAFSPWVVSAVVLTMTVGVFFALYQRLQRRTKRQVQRNIHQLATLRALISSLQRHRGLSTGVISGDDSLRPELDNARATVDQLMQDAQNLNTNQPDGWQGLFDHWSRLRNAASPDPVNNMTQHHLMIRNAIFLMEDVTRELDLTQGQADLCYLPCIWQEVVPAAEWAGQARALGTGIAAAQKSSAEQRVRLRFLHQKLQLMANAAFATLHDHSKTYPLTEQFRLQHCEQAVQDLLHCIDRELLSTARPTIAAKQYFQHATLAVDELLTLVDAALSDMARKSIWVQRHDNPGVQAAEKV